jgi:hypothetical protein
MKGLLIAFLFISLSIGLLHAQKAKIKSKNIVSAGDFCLTRVDHLLDGSIQNQTFEISCLNSKYPSDTEFKVFYKGTSDDMIQYLDSAIQFVKLNTHGATSMYKNTQFAIPASSSNFSLLLVVFSYDVYHLFKIAHLKKMKDSLEKYLITK